MNWDEIRRLRMAEQADAVANVGALTSTVAAGANPTKAEFDKVVADLATLRTAVNGLLDSLRSSRMLSS